MDPYRILGVPKGCTHDEVREAFRARALAAHPDRGGAELSFIQLRAAYEEIVAELERRAPARVAPRRVEAAPGHGGRSRPLVLTTDVHRAGTGDAEGIYYIEDPPDPLATREQYLAWLDRMSSSAERRNPGRRYRSARWIGAAFLLWVILTIPVALIGSFVAELPEVVTMTERGGPPADALRTLFGLAFLAAPVSAVWLAWKYR